jgi:hypothetical protein
MVSVTTRHAKQARCFTLHRGMSPHRIYCHGSVIRGLLTLCRQEQEGLGMNNVVRFPRRHVGISSDTLAARRAKSSADKPAALAVSVAKTRVHQSGGMASRLTHLRTTEPSLAPNSAAIASRERHKSMIERNELRDESAMPGLLGHTVPICKGNMVRDLKIPVGHSGPMGKAYEKLSDSEWRAAFQERLKRIQGHRGHDAMADLLEMPVETWKKCVNRGDSFPLRRLPKLASFAGIPIESLIKGDRDDELPAAVVRYRKRIAKAATRRAG